MTEGAELRYECEGLVPAAGLSFRQCVGVGDRYRNSDDKNNASVKTNAVAGASSNIESYNGPWSFGFMHIYSAWFFLLLLCFTFLLILKSTACSHIKLCYISSEVPGEVMRRDVGGCYRS